jgi:hypothetical protein
MEPPVLEVKKSQQPQIMMQIWLVLGGRGNWEWGGFG